jgi:hypothetical protein
MEMVRRRPQPFMETVILNIFRLWKRPDPICKQMPLKVHITQIASLTAYRNGASVDWVSANKLKKVTAVCNSIIVKVKYLST